jgi:arginyl-tRNA synthetase
MPSLTADLSALVSALFVELGLPAEFGRVAVSARPELGHFQCNGAMAAAKRAGRNPREVAQAVVERLQAEPSLRDVSLAGPGFINLSLTDAALAERLAAVVDDARLGVPVKDQPATVVMDYGGPNVAKAMHVGHLRAALIGESLKRLFRFVGDTVYGDVHLGDWGLPMGQLLAFLADQHPDWPYFTQASGPFAAESPVSIEDLERIYPLASTRCKEDPAFLEQARAATAALQAGHPSYRALWQHFFDVSVARLKEDFGALGVTFDLWQGEASVDGLIPGLVQRFKDAGLAVESDGALVVPVVEPSDKKEMPPLILLKADGAVLYATTDLATILDRFMQFRPDLVLYVVDQRQGLHFEQVFRAARKADLSPSTQFEHAGFGTVNGTDGKPFKTRAGGVMKLGDLIRMGTEAARARLDEAGLGRDLGEDELAETARQVGLAAIKFADLGNFRASNYVFDLDRFMRFEGRTGPYLQYGAVRIKSLLRKAGEQGLTPGAVIAPQVAEERDLVLLLLRLPDAVERAYSERAPNVLADFAFDLATLYSRFYSACHILTEPDSARQVALLALSATTLRQLQLVLDLLGIEIPERM